MVILRVLTVCRREPPYCLSPEFIKLKRSQNQLSEKPLKHDTSLEYTVTDHAFQIPT